MADFLFVVRAFVVTVLLFLAMQIRVGSRTVEQHSVAWVHSSSFVETLQDVSDGAVHVVHVASHKVTGLFTHLPEIKTEGEGTHEAKHRMAKRAEARKALSHNVVAGNESRNVANDGQANAAVAPAAQSAGVDEKQADERKGSFRSFFDVKTVHDADSN